MIPVSEAKNLIKQHTRLLAPENDLLSNAGGLVLAADVFAKVSVPNFHQSAMDGFAFRFDDFLQKKEMKIIGEVAAGDEATQVFAPFQAVRIFTGAALPPWADTVVMQEKTNLVNDILLIEDEYLLRGSNVRNEGSEIKTGDLALHSGTVLTPAAIGFLAGIGITTVQVIPKPTVHIIVTGKELQQPGTILKSGQVYESNSVMLRTALQQLHINKVSVEMVNDNLAETQIAISKALQNADLILLTGGVSVGNYDYVVQAATHCGIHQIFHKIKQRPGKPLYAGTKDEKIVFGLPGNPASVLTCFYVYVVAAIENFTGKKNLIERKELPLASAFSKKVKLTQFLKACCHKDEVEVLAAQESFRLSSFSLANSLVVLPEEQLDFEKGEMVETLILPYL